MKLYRILLLFFFGVALFAELVSSFCLIRNSTEPDTYWYQCLKSDDYLSYVKAAPIDIKWMTFSNSYMKIVRDRSFARLGSSLERLGIEFSKIEDIESHAFDGLFKLWSLSIMDSNLLVVKGAWFKDLKNLKRVSFRRNEIKRIEGSFFSTVPPLQTFDVSENKLECLPVDSFADFKTFEFSTEANPFSWVCLASLLNWFKGRDIHHDYYGRNNIDVPIELLNACVEELPKSQMDEGLLEKCVEKTVNKFLMPGANYTVDQLCQFLNNERHPYLDCNST